MLGALAAAARRGVDDERALAVGRRVRRVLAQVDARRDDLGVRHPADRVVGADDPGVGLARPGELGGRLAADVRAEEVEDRALPLRPQERELQGLRHEREPEVEVEDVGVAEQPRERAPLGQLLPGEPAVPVERLVRLGVELVALEDDEPRVDALAPEREHVLPRDAGGVDRAVGDAERRSSRDCHAPERAHCRPDGSVVRGFALGWVRPRSGVRPCHSSHSTWSK